MKFNLKWTLLIHLLTITNSLYIGINTAKAQVTEIKNASWKEVPGTKFSDPPEGYDESFYVDVSRVIKKGNIVTYDAIAQDASYARMQINCRNYQIRAIRQGFFKSDTQVVFESVENDWSFRAEPYWRKISKFVCNL